jgi:hypothetical protein
MSFEMMLLVLAGKSNKVVQAVEKELKPYVTGSKVYRQK